MSDNKSKPVKTVVFMMAATLLSKVLGLLRETLLASHYGAGNSVADAFSAALSVPSTFFDILFSAAILGCFVPIYNSFGENGEKADRFACNFLSIVSLFTGLLALFGIIFAEPIINIVTPGLEDPALAVRTVRILFPMIIFTGAAYTLVGLMQSKGRFFLPALISCISNAGVIVYFVFLDGVFGITGLAVAYAASWLIQFFTLALPLAHSGFKFRVVLDFRDSAVRGALKMVLPIMIGSWLSPMTILIGKHYASPFGGVSLFNYANQTYIMVAGILVYSICNYVFPTLSRYAGDGDTERFNSLVRTGTYTAQTIIVPVCAAVAVLSPEICAVLYMRGKFTAVNTADCAGLLRIIAFAMPAYGLIEIFDRVFYSKKKTLFPMLASGAGVLTILAVCALGTGALDAGLKSVALGVCCGQWIAAAVLTLSAAVCCRGLFSSASIVRTLKLLICAVASGTAMFFVRKLIPSDPYGAGMLINLAVCAAVFAVGCAVYALLAFILKALPSIGRTDKGGDDTL